MTEYIVLYVVTRGGRARRLVKLVRAHGPHLAMARVLSRVKLGAGDHARVQGVVQVVEVQRQSEVG